MKYILPIISIFAGALAMSCKPAGEGAAVQAVGDTARPSPLAQDAGKGPLMPARYYNFGQKTEFVMAMREQLEELNKELDELSVKIDHASEAVQAEAKPKLAALRAKAVELREQVEEDSNATLSTWNVMKGETEDAFASLRHGIAQSRQGVFDKVAP